MILSLHCSTTRGCTDLALFPRKKLGLRRERNKLSYFALKPPAATNTGINVRFGRILKPVGSAG